MSAAKDALLQLRPDIFAAQEIRDWDSFAELTSVLPRLVPVVVSRHRDSPKGGSISAQQIGIASVFPAASGWSESFQVAPESPPRGFSFAAIPLGGTTLLVYSVHLKANSRGIESNIGKREEAARQILAHLGRMTPLYGQTAPVIICGDFNTDPSDPRFSRERTFQIFQEAGFKWPWEGVPLKDRITLPAKGSYPDACFDGFLFRGDLKVQRCQPLPVTGVSDHYPIALEFELN
jgi:endonuclease/exonuclease/phosphatase family metal-dependent hydrolase